MNGELILTFESPLVRSLAWSIGSAPLLKSRPEAGLDLPDPTFFMDLIRNMEPWLRELDADDSGLEHWINSRGSKLLGKRFEDIISFFFRHAPECSLIAENVQFFRNGTTIGEADFIASVQGEILHVETACKYYLGMEESSEPNRWVGPNAEDRLEDKISRLKEQLQLFDTPEGKRYCAEKGLGKVRSIGWIKGYFFHHFQSLGKVRSPKGAFAGHEGGWWARQAELSAFADAACGWVILPHLLGIGPWKGADHEVIADSRELMDLVSGMIKKSKRSVMLIQVHPEHNIELSRGIILP